MKEILEFLLNLLYPNVCGFCGKINENSLCEKCEEEINPKLIYKIEKHKDMFFEEHIYLANYEGKIREYILSYKFFEKAYMYKTFAKLILKNEEICRKLKTYDIIGIVPVHKKRKAERGYDQSELIAREIAKNIKEIKYEKILKKIKNNVKQSSLNEKARRENVKNVYDIQNKEIIENKRIILFDDIYTTGSTVNECSRILKENGAEKILVLSLAK